MEKTLLLQMLTQVLAMISAFALMVFGYVYLTSGQKKPGMKKGFTLPVGSQQ